MVQRRIGYDNKLYPLVETNRGCPFKCTFCQQGEEYFSKVAMRDAGCVNQELELIARNMVEKSPDIARIELADPNFAMYKQDMNTVEQLRKCQDTYGWPRMIGCSTGKNKAAQVLDAVNKVQPDTLVISSSMQSTNPDTLAAVKRDNISLDAYSQVQTEIHRRGLRSMADVILGLPRETLRTHQDAVYGLVDSGIQEFTSYQAMVLKSTELEMEDSRETYGLDIRWRVLPRGLGQYKINSKETIVAELEQIVVATNTLPFEDYLSARTLNLVTMIYHNSNIFSVVSALLNEHGVKNSELIKGLYGNILNGTSKIGGLAAGFREETETELFETEDDCLNFYQNEKTLIRVKNSEIGANLLFKYLSLGLFRDWRLVTEELLNVVARLLNIDNDLKSDLFDYLQARVIDVSQDAFHNTKILHVRADEMLRLLGFGAEAPIREKKREIVMTTDAKTLETLRHYKTIYQNNPNGWSQMLAILRPHTFLRRVDAHIQ